MSSYFGGVIARRSGRGCDGSAASGRGTSDTCRRTPRPREEPACRGGRTGRPGPPPPPTAIPRPHHRAVAPAGCPTAAAAGSAGSGGCGTSSRHRSGRAWGRASTARGGLAVNTGNEGKMKNEESQRRDYSIFCTLHFTFSFCIHSRLPHCPGRPFPPPPHPGPLPEGEGDGFPVVAGLRPSHACRPQVSRIWRDSRTTVSADLRETR